MVKKFIELLDGNGTPIDLIECDNRLSFERCLERVAYEQRFNKKAQFMQLLTGKNSRMAKPIFSPKRIN